MLERQASNFYLTDSQFPETNSADVHSANVGLTMGSGLKPVKWDIAWTPLP
jgi:hypothetical protein